MREWINPDITELNIGQTESSTQYYYTEDYLLGQGFTDVTPYYYINSFGKRVYVESIPDQTNLMS